MLDGAEYMHLEERFERFLGEELRQLLDEEQVTDVLVNDDGRVWVERVGCPLEWAGFSLEPERTMALIKTTASMINVLVHEGHPVLEARVPGRGLRFQALIPPVVSAPAIAMRKPARIVRPLVSYLETGRMSEAIYAALRAAVADRRNILVVGGTGSGKTTLANAILGEIAASCPHERLFLIEDTRELQPTSENVVPTETAGVMTMAELLRASLRMRPDRIVVGEVRGAEALQLIKAWNTGHSGGSCTVHADSALAGLMRVEQMAAEGTQGFVPRAQVAQAVNVLVFIARRNGARRVEELVHVRGLKADGTYEVEEVIT